MTPAKVRWGFLSTARINRRILAAAEKSELAEVVAVASRDADRAEAYAVEHGIPRSHGSYEALIEDLDVDAVYISLPNSLHVEWSVRALTAGKHVLCEKPLTRSVEDAEAAFDAAERAGRILMEAFMWRHSPQTAKLVQLVEGGVIGELQLVRAGATSVSTQISMEVRSWTWARIASARPVSSPASRNGSTASR